MNLQAFLLLVHVIYLRVDTKRGHFKFGFLHELITWERHPFSCEANIKMTLFLYILMCL
jgi:hypothetical protein